MFKKLHNLIFYLLLVDVSSFIRPFNRIILNKLNSINKYEYGEEYYEYLLEYGLIDNKSLLRSGYLGEINDIIEDRKEKYYIFENNYKKILEFNNDNNSTFKLGINEFIDTFEIDKRNNLMKNNINYYEIVKNDFLGVKQIIEDPKYYLNKYKNLSDEFIWNSSIISDVKNQGRCGSCWAFSSTGAIEANMRINNFTINRLSEQELVDCSKENHGCNGGLMHLAFDYCIENKGLTSNDNYNYSAKSNECLYNCNITNTLKLDKINGSNIQDYKFTIPRSVLDLKASLLRGPISIALDASQFEFRFYKDGVIDIPVRNNSRINHAVLLTGYSKNEDGSYWIIQNSWGIKWGDNGYAKIRMKNGDGVLLCQLYGVYPYN